jgi:hemerythrin
LPFIVWKDSYRTHIPEIDADHAHLLVVANYLYEAVLRGSGSHVVRGALGELCSYAETHFATEEGLMASCGYPDLSNHRNEHIEFLARLHALVANSLHVQAKDLFDTLRKSLLRHFLTTDRDYTACVKTYLGLQP